MKKVVKKIASKKEYLFISFIIFILINFIFAIKGVYPYGKITISNGDMGQAYVPLYYYLHDLIHGKASFMMNYNIGYGQDMYDITAIYGFLSPISWLVGLTKRANIPNFLSYLFMIRVILLGLSSFWVLKRIFKKCPLFYLYLFSILYAFSGYILGYYTNFVWLDNIILFPLLFYTLLNILNGKKGTWYMILLALSISLSFYISFMEGIFILFFSCLYLHFYIEKKDQKKIILNLVLHTLWAILISMMFWLPVIMEVMTSARSNIDIYTNGNTKLITKLVTPLFYSLPILGCILYFTSKQTKKKEKIFSFLLLCIVSIGIFIEPINIMWHTGSYLEFPLRYGFIIIWVIYLIALRYFEREQKLKIKDKSIYRLISGILILILFVVASKYISKVNVADPSLGIKNNKIALIFMIYFVISMMICFLCFLIKDKKIKQISIFILVFIEICTHSFAYIGIPSDKVMKEHSDQPLFLANNIYEFLKDDDNGMKRYKNLNYDLFENSPLIVSKPFLSTWHLTQKYERKNHIILGYGMNGSKLSDVGGTIFSDEILGVHKIMTNQTKDESFYKLVKKQKELKLYEYSKSIDFGIVYPKNQYKEIIYGDTPFQVQNKIFHALFSQEDDIIHELPFYTNENELVQNTGKKYKVKADTILTIHYSFEEKSNLYFYANDIHKYISGFIVNGEKINFPYINFTKNNAYNMIENYQYGIADLGAYEGDVEVLIYVKSGTTISNPTFAYITLSEFQKMSESHQNKVEIENKNGLQIKTSASQGQALFLPINYSDEYECTVNGKKVTPDIIFNNFISIDLEEGENTILLHYTSPFLKMSMIYSLCSIVIYILGYFLLKKMILKTNLLDFIIFILYHLVCFVFFILIYIYAFFR